MKLSNDDIKMDNQENKTVSGVHNLLKGLMAKDKLLIIFLAGVLLFIICIPVKKTSKNSANSSSLPQYENAADNNGGDMRAVMSEEQYKDLLEEELCNVLSTAYGVGDVQVMITLESGSESVVKEDVKTSGNTIMEKDTSGGVRETKETSHENTVVYINEEGNTIPYVIKEKMPAIAGVLVVAEGGDRPEVVQNISEAVKALFDVDAHKIKVMKMNK